MKRLRAVDEGWWRYTKAYDGVRTFQSGVSVCFYKLLLRLFTATLYDHINSLRRFTETYEGLRKLTNISKLCFYRLTAPYDHKNCLRRFTETCEGLRTSWSSFLMFIQSFFFRLFTNFYDNWNKSRLTKILRRLTKLYEYLQGNVYLWPFAFASAPIITICQRGISSKFAFLSWPVAKWNSSPKYNLKKIFIIKREIVWLKSKHKVFLGRDVQPVRRMLTKEDVISILFWCFGLEICINWFIIQSKDTQSKGINAPSGALRRREETEEPSCYF